MNWSTGGLALLAAAALALTSSAAERAVLFPEPLHLVRQIAEGSEESRVEQYCEGNRVVQLSGRRVTVTDYEKREVREIDRERGTISVVSFEDLARAQAALAETHSPLPVGQASPATAVLGDGHFRIDSPQLTLEVRLDGAVTLTPDAFDALAGAAYPYTPRPEHAALRKASRVDRAGRFTPATEEVSSRHRLPVEQRLELRAGGERLRVTSRVVAINRETVPRALLVAPAGARQIEHRLVQLARELQNLDRVTVPLQ